MHVASTMLIPMISSGFAFLSACFCIISYVLQNLHFTTSPPFGFVGGIVSGVSVTLLSAWFLDLLHI